MTDQKSTSLGIWEVLATVVTHWVNSLFFGLILNFARLDSRFLFLTSELGPFDPQQHLLEVVEEWAQKQPNKEALVDAYESGLDCWGIAGGPLKFGVGSDSPVTNETFAK